METDMSEANGNQLLGIPSTDDRTKEVKTLFPNPIPEIPRILIGVPILAWTHEFATSFLDFWTDLMTYQNKGTAFLPPL